MASGAHSVMGSYVKKPDLRNQKQTQQVVTSHFGGEDRTEGEVGGPLCFESTVFTSFTLRMYTHTLLESHIGLLKFF